MARYSWIGALLALALAACEEQPRETSWGPIPPAQTGEVPPAAVDSTFMQGEWTLATLGAWPPQAGTPDITFNITTDRIEARSDCKHLWWTYRLTEQGLATTAVPYPEAQCERKLSVWEMAFEEAMTRANVIEMEPDGGVYIRGAGGEMKLRRG